MNALIIGENNHFFNVLSKFLGGPNIADKLFKIGYDYRYCMILCVWKSKTTTKIRDIVIKFYPLLLNF